MARIKNLVERLPQGLDTKIGEDGIKISGGERQRLGIARALYHKPEFIVFDEATSALDNITEAEFSEALPQTAWASNCNIYCSSIIYDRDV